MRIVLVGCGKAKLAHWALAKDMYKGGLFRAARGFAESSGERWGVVSALHDFLDPDEPIAPYDETMKSWGPPQQAWLWGVRVIEGVFGVPGFWRRFVDGEDLVLELHAGRAYADPLREAARRWQGNHDLMIGLGKIKIEEPLHGLQIGERLAWYKRQRVLLQTQPTPLG